MHEKPTAQSLQRRCRGCGNPLARDHEGDLYCSACRLERRDYNPAHDPQFGDRLLELLTSNPRRRLNVYRELGIVAATRQTWHCVGEHIARLRRHGHRIVGYHDGTYEYRGYRAPKTSRASAVPARLRHRPR